MKKIINNLVLVFIISTGFIFAEEVQIVDSLNNPFSSLIDRFKYDKYQDVLQKQRLEAERRRREEEKRKVEIELRKKKELEKIKLDRKKRTQERQNQLNLQEERKIALMKQRIEMEKRLREAKKEDEEKKEKMHPKIKQREIGFPEFIIQGIIFSDKSPRVLINNEVYSRGDRIGEAIDIINIKKEEVEFLYNGEVFVRSIFEIQGVIIEFEEVQEDIKKVVNNKDKKINFSKK